MTHITNPIIEPYLKAFEIGKIDVNAGFSIKSMGTTVYFTITPAKGKGRQLKPEDVISKLEQEGFRADKEKKELITEMVNVSKNYTVGVYNCPLELEKINLADEAMEKKEIEVIISPDKFKAYLKFNLTTPKNLNPEDLLKILREAGVTYGIVLETIKSLSSIIKRNIYDKTMLVATGSENVEGRSAGFKLKSFFTKTDLNEYRSPIIKKGTEIALKKPFIEASPKKLVTGETIGQESSSGSKDIEIITGEGISAVTKEDGILHYSCLVDGIAVLKNKRKLYMIPAVDAEFSLHVSGDKTRLLFDAIIGKNRVSAIKTKDVVSKIIDMGVSRSEIKEELLNTELEKLRKGEVPFINALVIVEGIKPIHGEDGDVEFKVPIEKNYRKVFYREDGSIDHKRTTTIHTVKPDDILAVITPPNTHKKDGINIYGSIIPAKSGRWPRIEAGEGTVFKNNNLHVCATVEGKAIFKTPVLKVEPQLHIRGDVDYSTGGIDFKGDLVVSGDVLDGFDISCSGDITIAGNVEACTIFAGGDILISGGISGKTKARIFSGGNIKATYAEQARVEARGNIIITKSATLSKLYSAKNVIVASRTSSPAVVGCDIIAKNVCDINKVGSERGGAASKIILGYDYDLVRNNKRIQKQLRLIQIQITKLSKEIERQSGAETPDEKKISQLNVLLTKDLGRFDQLLYFQNEFLKLMDIPSNSIFVVRKVIYPEAHILMEGFQKDIKERYPACIFKKDGATKRVITERYNPSETYYSLEEENDE